MTMDFWTARNSFWFELVLCFVNSVLVSYVVTACPGSNDISQGRIMIGLELSNL